MYIVRANYFLLIVNSFYWSRDKQDTQLLNAVKICVLDLLIECCLHRFFPVWKRRQMLLLDCLIRFMYSGSELWYMEVFPYLALSSKIFDPLPGTIEDRDIRAIGKVMVEYYEH